MHKGIFGTAINCMDGRVQEPVLNWLKKNYALDYVDMITEPGPDKVMVHGKSEQIESIKSRVLISVNAHGSRIIFIAAHYDCAGNPVPQEEHINLIKECKKIIKSWNLPVKDIIGAWIDEDWKVHPVK
jgi:hypothetical protein